MTLVALVIKGIKGFNGRANCYQVLGPDNCEGLSHGDHFIASAAVVPNFGPEVYLFKSNEQGVVTDWCELPGSRRGTLDIEAVVAEAGFTVVATV